MTERGILFSAPMVRAILDGAKTQTRRLVTVDGEGAVVPSAKPLVDVGDTLWVREAWRVDYEHDALPPRDLPLCVREPGCVVYDAGPAPALPCHGLARGRYRHARFMPRWASRLTLRVSAMRAERLGDISEADAVAEGAVHWARSLGADDWSPLRAFHELWKSVHGDGAWSRDRGRFVWVYEWERENAGRCGDDQG